MAALPSSESIEHKVLDRFLDKLATAFNASHLSLANELVSKGIIPRDVLNKALAVGVDDATKATLIVKSALDQIQVSPRKYHDFMALPSFNDPCHRSLHKKITAAYESLKADYAELRRASQRGELDKVKQLIEEKKLNPLQNDENGDNALHHAAAGGHLPVIQYLIEDQNLDPAGRGQKGQTALHIVVYGNNFDVVKYLIKDRKVDPWCRDEEDLTPLHRACDCPSVGARGGSGDVSIVSYLEKEMTQHIISTVSYLVNEMTQHLPLKDVIYDRTKIGNTPAHLAALNGHLQVVKLFISEFNFDPNTPGFEGRPLLHNAAQNGHLDIVKYLTEELKCDPLSCPGEDKVTPLQIASQEGHLAVVKYLSLALVKQCKPLPRNSHESTPLHSAAYNGRFEVVDFFISQLNCDPNTPGWQGRTPLHSAAQEGHLKIVQYLIEEHNCNPSNLDDWETTPLHLAAWNGHIEIIKYLTKEQHCNHLCYDKILGVPLHWAAHFGQLEAVKYFIEELKCPQNIRGPSNTTSLEQARIQGHTKVVDYLRSH